MRSKEDLVAFFQERLERERQSIATYNTLLNAKRINNPKLEALLKMIVNDSQNHVQLYSQIIEKLKHG